MEGVDEVNGYLIYPYSSLDELDAVKEYNRMFAFALGILCTLFILAVTGFNLGVSYMMLGIALLYVLVGANFYYNDEKEIEEEK